MITRVDTPLTVVASSSAEPAEGAGEAPRRRGRPRRGEPAFPEDQVDALLVYGETALHAKTGSPCQRFPSIREVARRFGVSHTAISEYSRRKNCIQRREELQARIRAKADRQLADIRANAVVITQDDMAKVVSQVFAAFVENLEAKRIRFDTVRDLAVILELHQNLYKTAASEAEAPAGLSLEDLQSTHRGVLAQPASPEVRGDERDASSPPAAGSTFVGKGTGKL